MTVDHSRTRSVSAAAAANSTIIEWLEYVIRSGTARLEYGPSSIARHQLIVSARPWGNMVGSVIAICTADILAPAVAPLVTQRARPVCYALASRRGSFQLGRTKWQVYPFG